MGARKGVSRVSQRCPDRLEEPHLGEQVHGVRSRLFRPLVGEDPGEVSDELSRRVGIFVAVDLVAVDDKPPIPPSWALSLKIRNLRIIKLKAHEGALMRRLVVHGDKIDSYKIPTGADNFVAYLSGIFPDEAGNIERFISYAVDLFAQVRLLKAIRTPLGHPAHPLPGAQGGSLPEPDLRRPIG